MRLTISLDILFVVQVSNFLVVTSSLNSAVDSKSVPVNESVVIVSDFVVLGQQREHITDEVESERK